jgi:hypothetical protein
METIFIYVLKSSAILSAFYLCYHFLVQKETFFNCNRWFLLLGLLTSISLPLFFIKKVVYVETNYEPLKLVPLDNNLVNVNESVQDSFNWFLLFPIIYAFVGLFFILKLMINLMSLYKLLHKKEVIISKPFALVDVNEKINPFSFFKYIVFNSNLYSKTELESILNHEKVHSQEKHTIDVLIANLICPLFWFNPLVWLYKKAILQNLEYIADQKAIQHIEDKKAYQMTLLKVVTNHNYLPITNSFYQSLIKKRIVMLNKNQSKQYKIWKYAVIVPALIAFVVFFQVNVIAQEKKRKNTIENKVVEISTVIVCDKSSDEELSADVKRIKKYADIDLKFSKIKRNKKGEIIAINASFNDNKGSKGQHKINGDEPISRFKFSVKKFKNGRKEIGFFDTVNREDYESYEDIVQHEEMDEIAEYPELPETPEVPEAPEMPEDAEASDEVSSEFPTPPSPPSAPSMKNMPSPPAHPNFPTMPKIKEPADPNDSKAWEKYEAEINKFVEAWQNGPEMKKFQEQMLAYEKKMEKFQPDMTAFEKAMDKFEAKMEEYQAKMEAYREAHLEKIQERQEAQLEAQREAAEARREAMQARREAMNAKRESLEARKEAILAKKRAERNEKIHKNN